MKQLHQLQGAPVVVVVVVNNTNGVFTDYYNIFCLLLFQDIEKMHYRSKTSSSQRLYAGHNQNKLQEAQVWAFTWLQLLNNKELLVWVPLAVHCIRRNWGEGKIQLISYKRNEEKWDCKAKYQILYEERKEIEKKIKSRNVSERHESPRYIC